MQCCVFRVQCSVCADPYSACLHPEERGKRPQARVFRSCRLQLLLRVRALLVSSVVSVMPPPIIPSSFLNQISSSLRSWRRVSSTGTSAFTAAAAYAYVHVPPVSGRMYFVYLA